jgi:hypothetical protein
MRTPFRNTLIAMPLAGLVLFATNASAAVITVDPSFTTTSGGDHVFNLAVPTTATGDAILELSFTGDYDFSSENATITLDGLSLGTVFNENGADDRFDFDFNGTDDVPDDPNGDGTYNDTDFNFLYTSSATISLAELLPLLADGQLILTIDNSDGVSPLGVYNFPASYSAPDSASSFVQGTLTIQTARVPAPASALLMALGLLSVGLVKRR